MNYYEQPTADTLMRQAAYTASHYMCSAKEDIDRHFGEGYAEDHPELVGAYINAATLDFLATFLHGGLEDLGESIRSAGDAISTALEERGEVK